MNLSKEFYVTTLWRWPSFRIIALSLRSTSCFQQLGAIARTGIPSIPILLQFTLMICVYMLYFEADTVITKCAWELWFHVLFQITKTEPWNCISTEADALLCVPHVHSEYGGCGCDCGFQQLLQRQEPQKKNYDEFYLAEVRHLWPQR